MFGIVLIILLILFLCWPAIARWMRGYMARRAEDLLRNATGMPPRPGSRKARQQARQQASKQTRQESYGRRRQGFNPYYDNSDGPIIPKEYAEDVEFVETKDYSEDSFETIDENVTESFNYHESQVSDVEWEEIKVKSGKKK